MKKVTVLMNPAAGSGRSVKMKSRLIHAFARSGLECQIHVSASEKHLCELAAEKMSRTRVMVVAGGDTSFRTVAREVLKSGSLEQLPALGMCGLGSANDIAVSLGTETMHKLAEAVKAGSVGMMDVGKAVSPAWTEEKIFLGTLSSGLGVVVNRYLEDHFLRRKSRGGITKKISQAAYGFLAVYRGFKKNLVPENLTVSAGDRTIEMPVALLAVLNIQQYAGGLIRLGHAGAFDGELDCIMVSAHGMTSALKTLLCLKKKKPDSRIEILRSPVFDIAAADELRDLFVQLDGDVFYAGNRCRVSLDHGALKVICRVDTPIGF